MSYLRERRETLHFTQTEVGRRCGMSRQLINRIENGRVLPSRQQARDLQKLLGVPVLCVDNLMAKRDLRSLCQARPFEVEPVNGEPWKAAYQYWCYRLQLREGLWDWMSSFLPADSSRECYAMGQFAAQGAREFLGSPTLWGFDRHVIVDRRGRLLAERVLPGLVYESPEVDILWWPQVSLRVSHTFRVDGLLFFRRGTKYYWIILEIDGNGHDGSKDEYRAEQLDMPTVRVSGDEVGRRDFFRLLVERADAEIAKLRR